LWPYEIPSPRTGPEDVRTLADNGAFAAAIERLRPLQHFILPAPRRGCREGFVADSWSSATSVAACEYNEAKGRMNKWKSRS